MPYKSLGRFLRHPVYTDWGSFPIPFLPFPCFTLHFFFLSIHFPFHFLSFSFLTLLPPLLPSSFFPFRLAIHGSVRMLPVMQCFRGTALRVQVDIFSRYNLIFYQLSLVTITCHWKFRSVRHSNNNFCLKIICYISVRVYHGIYIMNTFQRRAVKAALCTSRRVTRSTESAFVGSRQSTDVSLTTRRWLSLTTTYKPTSPWRCWNQQDRSGLDSLSPGGLGRMQVLSVLFLTPNVIAASSLVSMHL